MANRSDQALVTVSVVGGTFGAAPYSLGTWEDRKGGGSDSTSTVYPRGGMGDREALGGRQEVANVIAETLLDERARGFLKKLRDSAGRCTVTVNEDALDDEGVVIPGSRETWTGKLKKVETSERKADSNAAEMLTIEVVVAGKVA